MAKTAEEILKNKRIIQASKNSCVGQIDHIHQAMREFAAQEVEAYKERLKAGIGEKISGDMHDSYNRAFELGLQNCLKLIDAVK